MALMMNQNNKSKKTCNSLVLSSSQVPKEHTESAYCPFEGVSLKSMKKHSDERGWLAEFFRQDEINKEMYPVMSYVSITHPRITRGPHEHMTQIDYFCFLGPSTFVLYLWDNRKESPTYKEKQKYIVGEDNPVVAIIPPGVVHAYKNIGNKDGWVFNFPNRLYAGCGKKEKVDEIRYENNPDSPFQMNW